jgi:hypothetical protein
MEQQLYGSKGEVLGLRDAYSVSSSNRTDILSSVYLSRLVICPIIQPDKHFVHPVIRLFKSSRHPSHHPIGRTFRSSRHPSV